MSRAQPKPSPTDHYAKRIARAIANGQPPPISEDLERYCENSPGEVFAAFDGVACNLPPSGDNESLAVGYLFLLQRLLEHLRYRTDSGFADAVEMIADFQAGVVAAVEAGRVDAKMLVFVGGALHQSRIPVSAEFAAASVAHSINHAGDGELPADMNAAIAEIFDDCDDDPFVTVGVLAERTHAIPPEARAALAGALALANLPKARSAAVLFLLDPDSGVRGVVARSLAEAPAGLTAVDLRRLIAIRNWRPESERADIDAVVRGARGAGIDCARWEGGSPEQIRATCIDGAASQSFVLVSPAGRKKRLSSILTKGGIADAWSSEPETRHRIEATLSSALKQTPTFPVSRSYVDRTIAEQLAVTVDRGEVPPFGLLEVAEAIGGADWQPARMDFNQTLGALIAEVPGAMLEPAAYSAVLRRSDALVDLLAVARSWFEDDPEVKRLMERRGRRNRSKLVTYLLQTVISRRRQRWGEIVLRTAVWMHEAPQAEKLCWRELALVAKAIADGRDLSEIGLMRDIAERTIEASEDDERT